MKKRAENISVWAFWQRACADCGKFHPLDWLHADLSLTREKYIFHEFFVWKVCEHRIDQGCEIKSFWRNSWSQQVPPPSNMLILQNIDHIFIDYIIPQFLLRSLINCIVTFSCVVRKIFYYAGIQFLCEENGNRKSNQSYKLNHISNGKKYF